MNQKSTLKEILSGVRIGVSAWTLIGLAWSTFIIVTHLDRPYFLLDLPLFRMLEGWEVERVSMYKIYIPSILDRIEFLYTAGLAHAILGIILGFSAGVLNCLLWKRSGGESRERKARALHTCWNLTPFLFLLILKLGPSIGKGVLIPPLIPRVLAIEATIAVVIGAIVFVILHRIAARPREGVDAPVGSSRLPGRLLFIFCVVTLLVTGVLSHLTRRMVAGSFEVSRSLAAPDPGQGSGRADNAILIIIDTLRADHLGCYGYSRPHTPRIDELAADGIRFENCISQAPWTIPSIMSIMTSLYPSVSGIMDDKGCLDPMRQTVAEAFQSDGFRTAGIVSHTFVDRRYGFGSGFDIFEDEKVIHQPADQITDLAISIIDEIKDDRFFLFIHYFDPHFPYEPPAPYDTIQVAPGVDVESMSWKEMKRFAHTRNEVPEPELNRIVGLYDGEIAFTDVMIGRLIDYLRESGLYDSTVIALTADHGEEFKDHGSMGHTRTLYDEVVHVPLIIRDPGSEAAGTVIEEQVRSIDIAPTLLGAVGVGAPIDFQGVDLSVFWSDPENAPLLTAFSETSRHALLRSIRTNDVKYIENIRRSFYHTVPNEVNTHELYDLRGDEKELRDRKNDGDPIQLTLRRQLFEWIQISGLEREWLPKTGGEETVTYDEETLNRLRALGYVQ